MTNISIISACNNNCHYCFQRDNYHKQNLMLDYAEVLKILEWSRGINRIGILGGEATLHPQCYEICKAAREGFATILFSNLLCDQELLSKLIKLDLKWLVNANARKELVDLFEDNLNKSGIKFDVLA